MKRYKLIEGMNRLVFLFSGGKDATFGLYMLKRYLDEYKISIKLDVVLVTYPQHVYFNENGTDTECYKDLKRYWKERGVKIKEFVSDTKDLDAGVANGCKICKGARKSIIDPVLTEIEDKQTTAIVTGYTLYDALAYLDELCLVSNYNFDMKSISDQQTIQRINNCLHKMQIAENLPNGFRIIRPLVVNKESDILKFIKERKLPYINIPCNVAPLKHKRAYFDVLHLADHITNATYEGLMSFLATQGVEIPKKFDDIQFENYFTDC
jgi:tRNA(Ile)-lysidine synthase TilS/MesJ